MRIVVVLVLVGFGAVVGADVGADAAGVGVGSGWSPRRMNSWAEVAVVAGSSGLDGKKGGWKGDEEEGGEPFESHHGGGRSWTKRRAVGVGVGDGDDDERTRVVVSVGEKMRPGGSGRCL